MSALDEMLLSLAGAPSLPGARCRNRSQLFDGGDGPRGVRTRQAAAMCQECPALDRCRDWADQQPPSARDGVVAGRFYAYVAVEQQRKSPNGIEVEL